MNKNEFVALVADKADMTKKDAERALDAVLESIEEVMVAGDKLQLVGFGSFETKFRKERAGVKPSTGEPITIAAATIPVFKPGKQLKEKVNR